MGGFLNPMLSVYRNQLEAHPRPSEDNPQDSANAMLEQLQRLPPQVQQTLFQKYPELRQRIEVGQGGPMGRPVPGSAAGLQPRSARAGARHQSAAAGSGLTGATAGGGSARQSQAFAPSQPKYQSPINTQSSATMMTPKGPAPTSPRTGPAPTPRPDRGSFIDSPTSARTNKMETMDLRRGAF